MARRRHRHKGIRNPGRTIVWISLAVMAVAGVAVAIVLLRGDPTYLVQSRTRGGAPWGPPAPVSFASRAFSVTVLATCLVAAGRRAVSDDGLLLWPVTTAGFALFLVNVIASAAIGRVFPAFLVGVWFSVPLPVIGYAEPLGELLRSPPWLIWGACLLVLVARLVWLGFQISAG